MKSDLNAWQRSSQFLALPFFWTFSQLLLHTGQERRWQATTMSRCEAPSKQLLQSLRKISTAPAIQSRHFVLRPFSTSIRNCEEAQADAIPKPSFRRNPDPQLVSSRRLERRLMKANNPPIGSRRRRIALQNTSGIPFEQLPFQCFQEARKILKADREEKLKQIETDRARILRLRESSPALSGGEARKQQRLRNLMDNLEYLKVMADINDPLVKRRFEDGLGRPRKFPDCTHHC
jgi:large subunit ribosomal protein L35